MQLRSPPPPARPSRGRYWLLGPGEAFPDSGCAPPVCISSRTAREFCPGSSGSSAPGPVSNMLAKLWLQWRAPPLLSSGSQSIPLLGCCMRPDCCAPLHSQDRTKVATASKLSPWRVPSARNCQLLSFSTSTEWYDRPASTKVPEPLFRRNADKKVGLVLQPAMHPLNRLKCLPRAALGCEAARLKPQLVLIVCWCGAMGTKPKVGERQADASEGRQSGNDQR